MLIGDIFINIKEAYDKLPDAEKDNINKGFYPYLTANVTNNSYNQIDIDLEVQDFFKYYDQTRLVNDMPKAKCMSKYLNEKLSYNEILVIFEHYIKMNNENPITSTVNVGRIYKISQVFKETPSLHQIFREFLKSQFAERKTIIQRDYPEYLVWNLLNKTHKR